MTPNWKSAQDAYPVNDRWVWLNNCGRRQPDSTSWRACMTTLASAPFTALVRGSIRPLPWGASSRPRLRAYFMQVRTRSRSCNNTAEAMHMVSLGLDLSPGDEILVLADEYPSNVYPGKPGSPRGVSSVLLRWPRRPMSFLHNFRQALGHEPVWRPCRWCTGARACLSH